MKDAAELARESREQMLEELRRILSPEATERVVSAIENLIEATVLMRITQARPPFG